MVTGNHIIHVAVAVIKNSRQQVLLTLRPDHVHQGGLWEFPGGKVESNETAYDALVREIDEELGIAVTQARPLIQITHDYGDRQVLLDVWLVNAFEGTVQGNEGQPYQWVDIDALTDRNMPAANLPIIRATQLPDAYLITPDNIVDIHAFLSKLERILKSGSKLIQFREKNLSENKYLSLAYQVVALARRYGARVMLNHTPEVFRKCDSDGLHLSSKLLMVMNKRPIGDEYYLSASCHNEVEVQQANKVGADFIVVSPVMPTLSHPDVDGIGWDAFQSLTEKASMPVYALGGMKDADKEIAFKYGGQGIAAIRSLWDVNS